MKTQLSQWLLMGLFLSGSTAAEATVRVSAAQARELIKRTGECPLLPMKWTTSSTDGLKVPRINYTHEGLEIGSKISGRTLLLEPHQQFYRNLGYCQDRFLSGGAAGVPLKARAEAYQRVNQGTPSDGPLVSAAKDHLLTKNEALAFGLPLVAGMIVLPVLSLGKFSEGGPGWKLLGGGVVLSAGSLFGQAAMSRAKFKKSKLPQEVQKMFRTIQAIERADVETVKACKAVIGRTFQSQEAVTAAQSACTAALPIVSEGDTGLSEQSQTEMRVAYSWRTPEHRTAIRAELVRLADFAGVDPLYFSCMAASKGTAPSISSQSSDWMEQRKRDCVAVQEFLKKYPTQSAAFGLVSDHPLTNTIKRIDKVYPAVKAKDDAREARERKHERAEQRKQQATRKLERALCQHEQRRWAAAGGPVAYCAERSRTGRQNYQECFSHAQELYQECRDKGFTPY